MVTAFPIQEVVLNRLQSIRARLLAVVLVSLLPTSLLFAIYANDQREIAEKRAREDLRVRLRLRVQVMDTLLEQARATLVALANQESTKQGRWRELDETVELLASTHKEYLNVGVASRDGAVRAMSLDDAPEVDVSDKRWFLRTIRSGQLSVGDYQVGRKTKVPVMVVGYPIRNSDGRINGAAFITFPVSLLRNRASEIQVGREDVLFILDSDGRVLVRLPEDPRFSGRRPKDSELVHAVLRGKEGEGVLRGLDGVRRYYRYDQAAREVQGRLFLVVGFDPKVAYAKVWRGELVAMLNLGVVALFALVLAYTVAGQSIVAPVERLTAVVRRLAAGDLRARAELPLQGDELGRLGAEFDAMARLLAGKIEELEEARAELVGLNAEMQDRAARDRAADSVSEEPA